MADSFLDMAADFPVPVLSGTHSIEKNNNKTLELSIYFTEFDSKFPPSVCANTGGSRIAFPRGAVKLVTKTGVQGVGNFAFLNSIREIWCILLATLYWKPLSISNKNVSII